MSAKPYISCMGTEVLCHPQKATLTDYIHTEVYRVQPDHPGQTTETMPLPQTPRTAFIPLITLVSFMRSHGHQNSSQ